ncbi:peroxiredoxin family protein [Natrialba sp. SSL1]|uniref:peroxiredoxin family protein n=1 Tax=Natrialba sp. SSL1 TaxID=1869245 RepID=UPI0008F93CAC|nr:alkyl hydroperoxide reductase [Natrialba sp. SSL1]OIB58704.1 alkyl hydroperoxide reductase [Natrialba sp. SSL1]
MTEQPTPTRREITAGTAGLTLATLAGCLDGQGSDGSTDDNSSDESTAAGADSPSLPLEITTADGPGSEAGTLTIPTDGVVLINFTRLHCPTSEGLLETIGNARERLLAESDNAEADDADADAGTDADNNSEDSTENDTETEPQLEYTVGRGEDLTVISVVSGVSGATPTEEELGEWWAEHNGNWTVGIDEEGALFDYYDVRSAPATRIVDSEGAVQWENNGGTATGSYVSAAWSALESDE